MCTAMAAGGVFGRTLDLQRSLGERPIFMPRNFALKFGEIGVVPSHLAMVGMAVAADGYPLFFDAMNESGLCAAALRLPKSAVYHPAIEGAQNVASFELIPWVLGLCAGVDEAERLLKNANITPRSFCDACPATPLHWMVSDGRSALAVESLADGLHVVRAEAGVLTNEPPLAERLKGLAGCGAVRDAAQDGARGSARGLQCVPDGGRVSSAVAPGGGERSEAAVGCGARERSRECELSGACELSDGEAERGCSHPSIASTTSLLRCGAESSRRQQEQRGLAADGGSASRAANSNFSGSPLPGGWSSEARFARAAAVVRAYDAARCAAQDSARGCARILQGAPGGPEAGGSGFFGSPQPGGEAAAAEFFALLDAVAVPPGATDGERTIYQSVCGGGLYCVRFAGNPRPSEIELGSCDLDSAELRQFERRDEPDLRREN